MLSTIIPYLEAKIDAAGIFQEVYGLGELVVESERTSPNLYLSAGQYKKLTDFDHETSFCYFRLTGAYTESNSEDEFIGGSTERIRTYPLKMVGYCSKEIYNTDDNYIDEKVASNVSLFISENEAETLARSLKADFVEISVTSTELRRKTVLDEEVSGDTSFINIPFDKVFFQIEFDVTVTGNIDCFDVYDCDDETTDVIELIRDKYCEDIECTDGTVNITNTDDTVLYSKSVASGGTAEQQIPDQTAKGTTDAGEITFPANTEGVIPDVDYTDSDGVDKTNPYGDALVCTPLSSLSDQAVEDGLTDTTRNNLQRLMHCKESEVPIIYSPNDSGDRNTGRPSTFLTLPTLNASGNNERFETVGADIVFDNATGYYWTKTRRATLLWGDHLTTSASLSLPLTAGGNVTNWKLPSIREYLMVMQEDLFNPLDYAPFNIVFFGFLATGNTNQANTSRYKQIFLQQPGWSIVKTNAKSTNGSSALYCVHKNDVI